MRFVSQLLIMTALSAAGLAMTSQAQIFKRADSQSAEAPRDPLDIRRRAAGTSETPIITQGLYAQRVSTGLGHVIAMASLEDGSIHALSKDKGQLFHLTDRGLDGRIDTQRPMTSGFDNPTGLALKDGQAFISDRHAVWRVDLDTGIKTQFVSLRHLKAADERPLLIYENRLLMGVSKSETLSSVLSIDLSSGEATHLTDIAEAPIRALSYGGGQLWAAVGRSLRPVDARSNTEFAKHYPLEAGAAAIAILLPSSETDWPADWPAAMKDYILAIQGPTLGRMGETNSGGNNVIALPTQFGAPLSNLSVLAGGFMSRDGQSAWAAPSALLIDKRGLFFAERLGGTLWRVSVDNRPPPKPRKRISEPLPDLPVQKPSLKHNETPAMVGSMIGESSLLGEASTLQVGSYLKKAHDEKEAAELAAKKAAEDAELKKKLSAQEARRLSRLGRADPAQND